MGFIAGARRKTRTMASAASSARSVAQTAKAGLASRRRKIRNRCSDDTLLCPRYLRYHVVGWDDIKLTVHRQKIFYL